MIMKQAHKEPVRRTWPRKKVVGVVAGSIVGLYVLSLFVPLVSAYSWYPIYLIKCGRQPIAASDFAASDSYDLPSDRHYNADILTTDRYFCTEAEAQAAWYHRDPLDK